MVNVLREAVLLEQLVWWVLKLGKGLRCATNVTQDWGALRRAGGRAEREKGGGGEVGPDSEVIFCSFIYKLTVKVTKCGHLQTKVKLSIHLSLSLI